MEVRSYSIYDTKAQAFNAPFFAANDEVAIRMSRDAVNRQEGVYAAHPEDFVLYHVGGFNDQTGELVGYNPAIHVCSFLELVDQKPLMPNLFEPQSEKSKEN